MSAIALFIIAIKSPAQEYCDLVYLKNGSVIRGLITQIKADDYIKILTKDQGELVYKMEEVLKTQKDIEADNKQKKVFPGINKSAGYCGIIKFTFPYFKADLDFINGYRFSDKFAAGIGAGFELYENYGIGMPVYVHLRREFNNEGFCPYLAWDLGAKAVFPKSWYPYFSQQAGIGFRINKRFRMTAALELPFVFTGKISFSPGLSVGFVF